MSIDLKNLINKKSLLIVYTVLILLFLITQSEKLSFESYKFCFMIFVFVLGFIILYCYYTKRINTNQLFCLTILIFGLITVFTTPILVAPDEKEHFARSEITSRTVLFPEYINFDIENNHSGFETIVSVNEGSNNFGNTYLNSTWANSKIDYEKTYAGSAFQQNPFYGYIAQGIGILLAKFLDLNNIWMLWFGRICNLITYILIVTYAIKKCPEYKIPLGLIACMPLAIYQASSLSIDALVNCLGILTIAYFIKMYKSKDNCLTYKNILIFYILVLIVSFTKATYLALIFLIFLIPKSRYKNKNTIYLSVMAFIITTIISAIYSIKYGAPNLYHSYRHEYFIIHNVNEGIQINYILHNPLDYLINLFNPIHIFNIIKKLCLFGSAPHRIDSNYLTLTYTIFLVLFSLFYPINIKFNKKSRIILLIIVALIFYGTLTVQYLTFTPVGANYIDGIWGRYFILLLPIFPLILSTNKFKTTKKYTNLTMTLMIGFVVILTLLNFLNFY